MNRLVRGSILVAVAGGLWACGGNPFDENLEAIASIKATPQIVFVSNVDSEAVVVEALNDLGNQNAAEFTISNQTSNIVVTQDTGFGLVIGGENLKTRARYFVRGTDSSTFSSGSFDVSTGGQSVTVSVSIVPARIPAAFSSNTPANGDTVTITLPAGVTFTSTSTVTLAGGVAPPIIIGVSADSTQITFVPPPGVSGPVSLDSVVVGYLPGQAFSVPTSSTLTTEGFASLGATYNTTTPTSSDTVVLTVPAGLRILPTATVDFAGDASAILLSISPDSTMLSVLVPPNTDAPITITGVIATGSPLFPFTITDSTRVQSPVVPNVPATFSTLTPSAGTPVVMTADPGFFFDPSTVSISFAGADALITNVSTDSTMVTFIAPPGITGRPDVSGVVVGPFTLTLATSQLIAAGASPFDPADNPSTAAALTLPSSGNSTTFYEPGVFPGSAFADFGGFPARFYTVTLSGSTTFDVTLTWTNGDDLGLYIWDAVDCGPGTCDFGTAIDGVDNLGGGSGGQPETGTVTLAAGTYRFALVTFDAAVGPGVVSLQIDTQ